jgi:hypothetical protein
MDSVDDFGRIRKSGHHKKNHFKEDRHANLAKKAKNAFKHQVIDNEDDDWEDEIRQYTKN